MIHQLKKNSQVVRAFTFSYFSSLFILFIALYILDHIALLTLISDRVALCIQDIPCRDLTYFSHLQPRCNTLTSFLRRKELLDALNRLLYTSGELQTVDLAASNYRNSKTTTVVSLIF